MIGLRTVAIGRFDDGSLKLDGKKLKLRDAAIIEFRTAADAQKFAQIVRMVFRNYDLAALSQPTESEQV